MAVLGGALTVGESVRASLRDLLFARLGNTAQVLTGSTFFREQFATDLGGAPAIALEGVAASERTRRRAARVQVWGVDERFWRFHGREAPSGGAIASRALAAELGVGPGDDVVLRIEEPSAIPLESLHGRKESAVRTLRLTLAPGNFGEFSLRPQQGAVRSLFVPLDTLARRLDRRGRANLALLAQPVPAAAVKQKLRLEDLGVRLRPLARGFAVESEGAIVSDALAAAVAKTGVRSTPVFTYLANAIRSQGREVPYSLVAAIDEGGVSRDGIALNEWAARELRAARGDPVTLEYYLWRSDGRLDTASATFRLERVLPMQGLGADRELAPEYPGITDSESLTDWDPPFPIDLSRIGRADEDYWRRHRATPKAFIALERGQELWGTRFGKLTSIRVDGVAPADFGGRLLAAIDPAELGLALDDVRARGVAGAAGATDFGEYFTYFSFFLVIAALLLAGLFFWFGVEQRSQEIGALRAMGFAPRHVRRLLGTEALALAAIGGVAGVTGAIAYAALIVYGLRTWWVDAVGTTLLSVHVGAVPLALGALGGAMVAAGVLFISLRRLRRLSPRGLIAGDRMPARRTKWAAIAAAAAALLLVAAGAAGIVGQAGAFFGAGGLLLVGALCLLWILLTRPRRRSLDTLPRLGFRYASYRPGRSVLTVALIALATFLIVAVDSFRREGGEAAGTGGFSLIAESALPLYHDPNTPEGRESLNLREDALGGAVFYAFRLRPGEDASCLNLYRPQNPRIVAPPRRFLNEARFRFADSLGGEPNPWKLLDSPPRDGAIPTIADANSLQYVFHRGLGDVIDLPGGARLRFVAALADSIFQSELIVSPENFVRAFPREQGFRLFLIATPAEDATAAALEEALADYGFDAVSTRERLAAFHRVENTYLSTFQALGALGLALGTAGLGAVLLRNVLERRRETALLRAVGFTPRSLRTVLLAESLFLLAAGLVAGTIPALVAIAPAWFERGGSLPLASLALLLGIVVVTGVAASMAALRFATRSPLLAALRSE